jgi:hypothetical protein
VVIIVLASLGVIQFIKGIQLCKKWPKRVLTVITILLVTLLRTYLIPKWVSDLGTVYLLGVSIVKIGFDAFLEGLPKLIKGKFAFLSGGGSQPSSQ